MRHELRQRRAGLPSIANGGRGRNEAHLIRRHTEGVQYTTHQQGDLRGLRADVGMRLIQHDPPQLALGCLQDGAIVRPNQQVLEHGRVGDQNRRGLTSQQRTTPDFLWMLVLYTCRYFVGGIAVIETESYSSIKARGPGPQPFTLAVDQRVERVEKERLGADQRGGMMVIGR